ncbi:hypothetical protein [Microbacterium sp. No. 7]|uniref:hypothetical protein n=1 Tax=Microbacterium sp. No. 7 TaxID=1714373 RepID=UPI0006D16AAF|nr:hypothetical protein [Microbacterium sp. No. 7]ALJ22058.1 hypothetical protein AOA12_20050 [Microbacterium sp. No. 7]
MSAMGAVHLELQETGMLPRFDEYTARARECEVRELHVLAGVYARAAQRLIDVAAAAVLEERCPGSNRRAGKTRAGALRRPEGNTT